MVFIGLTVYLTVNSLVETTLYVYPESEKIKKSSDALTNSGIDATIDPTTGDVMVPVPDIMSRVQKLAAQGLPSSVPGGYDTLGKYRCGTSRSVESMKLKQSQEMNY